MKSFAYTARDSSGTTKRGHLAAADRAAAIRDIRALGLVPVSIEERAAPAKASARRLSSPRVLMLVAGLVVVIGVLLVTLKRPERETSATTGMRATARATATAGTATPLSRQPPVADPATLGTTPRRHRPGPAVSATPTASAATEKTTATAEPAATEEPPAEAPPPPPERIYKTGTEQLLAMLGRPGEEMPPLPISGSQDLAADLKRAMTNLISIYETDDIHTVNRKETVAWLKVQLVEAEKEGWNPAEVIKALEEQRREEAAERKAAANLLAEMIREHPEQAKEARAAINAELMAKGILPLDPPIRRRRKP